MSKEFLMEFFKMYQEKPCLWDKQDLSYSNKEHRLKALKELHQKYAKIYKGATIANMKKKIENLRTNCYRELKKVLAAKAKGETYKPTLWYYDTLSFLYKDKEQDFIYTPACSYSSDNNEEKQSEIYELTMMITILSLKNI
ncbi:unnamed protein product [Leptidea sinapis]|uniref:MADF domain-containing protein n=1 Tax=Leptidea sinapis TaxID=189913 RepID=A0A5E4R142_9NEOP|nr:unnamed protein product [Leptidea sinapis]